ncbi:hypothetical protein GWI33_013890 [Rhynchophorus ferrugineus]|uniref:Uncharacterized protein n=1 Tax=Rhynchophorus ferrugineus TaxID=354439 RepID=A0A834MCV5_RHYFE|nr:hypothetical protein GWI33_013890 [Rhynchophorus ferrugineus]
MDANRKILFTVIICALNSFRIDCKKPNWTSMMSPRQKYVKLTAKLISNGPISGNKKRSDTRSCKASAKLLFYFRAVVGTTV